MSEFTAGKLSKILKEHKRWLDNEVEGEKADLSCANLSDVDLNCALLRRADLIGANLSDAYLDGAYLGGANLSQADLGGADLEAADLNDANLRGANLRGANLEGAYLAQVRNLSINQLSKVETLYKAELDPELMEQVKDEYPHLLKKPKQEASDMEKVIESYKQAIRIDPDKNIY